MTAPANGGKTWGMTASQVAPFLVFEGLDGSGKSTLIEGVAAELRARSKHFILTREPGGTSLAEQIRELLLRTDVEAPVAPTELLLYAASRAQHVAKVIEPSIKANTWVLCDRFTASSVAFQCYARGLSRADVDNLNRFACQGVAPSLTILLDLDVDESLKRRAGRTADRMENEARDFHNAVRTGYLEQARENPKAWLVLDARETPESIKLSVLKELEARGWLKA